MSDLPSVQRLIALAGSERVSSYTRHTKTGKTVHVSSYTRDPGKMTNNALYSEWQSLSKGESSLPQQAAQNRKEQIVKEIQKRQTQGKWGASDKRTTERARTQVSTDVPKPRGMGHSTVHEFQKNKVSPLPATDDKSYAEHVAKIKAILEDPANAKFDTQKMFGFEDPSNPGKYLAGVYQPQRAEQHKKIIEDLLQAHANVPKERKAIMSGGLGGSGKGTVLGKYADVNHNDYITIDPDEMKQELLKRGMVPEVPGLLPLEHAAFIHEESSDLANLLHQAAMDQGMNVILDTTMASMSAKKKVDAFKAAGYDVEAIFVDVPVETSVKSALGRHKGGVDRFRTGATDKKGNDDYFGGRYVPPEIIQKSAPSEGSPYLSKNREIFEQLKNEGVFSRSRVFDNSNRDPGAVPKMVFDSSGGGAKKPAVNKVAEQLKKSVDKTKSDQQKVGLSAVEHLISLTRVK